MRDQWYGDNRDLVKWGVVLHLAREHDAQRILQVPYHRRNDWGQLEIDGRACPIPDDVIRHFRNGRDIVGLTEAPRIDVVESLFEDRDGYRRSVVDALSEARAGKDRLVLFLDPDTGLEPSKPGFEHVLEPELAEFWTHLLPGDVLVFYQHQTNRSGKPWISLKREQFEKTLGLEKGAAKVAQGRSIAPDVVFFFCQQRAK